MADVSVTENTVRLLSKRAAWYRDGCQDLEDRADYYASGDLARDAAGDLETALSEIRVLEMVVAKFRDPAAAARLVGSPEEPKHEGRRCYAHICGGNGHPDCPACQQQEQEQRNGTGMDLPALREADRNVQPHADSRRESTTTAEDRPDNNGKQHEVAPGDGRAARLQDGHELIASERLRQRDQEGWSGPSDLPPLASSDHQRRRSMPKKRELYTSVDQWATQARILLASLVLSEPEITKGQSREITHLLRSAKWIETFKRKHPWKQPPETGEPQGTICPKIGWKAKSS